MFKDWIPKSDLTPMTSRMDPDLVRVATSADWHDYHAIRRASLWAERGRSGYDDRHADETLPHHHSLLMKRGPRAIGTTRLDDRRDGTGVVRLVAIVGEARRQGHGRRLGALVEAYASRLGITTLLVNAAPDAEGFYAATGWSRFGWDSRELVGFTADCIQMRKQIVP